MTAAEDWKKSDCPINGNLSEEDRINCDECNKIACSLENNDIVENSTDETQISCFGCQNFNICLVAKGIMDFSILYAKVAKDNNTINVLYLEVAENCRNYNAIQD